MSVPGNLKTKESIIQSKVSTSQSNLKVTNGQPHSLFGNSQNPAIHGNEAPTSSLFIENYNQSSQVIDDPRAHSEYLQNNLKNSGLSQYPLNHNNQNKHLQVKHQQNENIQRTQEPQKTSLGLKLQTAGAAAAVSGSFLSTAVVYAGLSPAFDACASFAIGVGAFIVVGKNNKKESAFQQAPQNVDQN